MLRSSRPPVFSGSQMSVRGKSRAPTLFRRGAARTGGRRPRPSATQNSALFLHDSISPHIAVLSRTMASWSCPCPIRISAPAAFRWPGAVTELRRRCGRTSARRPPAVDHRNCFRSVGAVFSDDATGPSPLRLAVAARTVQFDAARRAPRCRLLLRCREQDQQAAMTRCQG